MGSVGWNLSPISERHLTGEVLARQCAEKAMAYWGNGLVDQRGRPCPQLQHQLVALDGNHSLACSQVIAE